MMPFSLESSLKDEAFTGALPDGGKCWRGCRQGILALCIRQCRNSDNLTVLHGRSGQGDGDEAAGVTSSPHALSQCNDVSRRQLHTFQAAFALTCVALSNRLSIGAPALALGLGNTIATGLRLRTCRFATVEAATRLARLSSDLAAAAGPRLGSAKAPALATTWRCLVRCQSHVPVLPVRPHDARARAHTSCIVRFDRFRPFSRVQRPTRYAVTQARNHRPAALPNPACGLGDRVMICLARWRSCLNPSRSLGSAALWRVPID
jgi:hypothetical protein